jgi:hypothetical protein
VRLQGLENLSAREPIEFALRDTFQKLGARVPTIDIRVVGTLERGATGKAPLILGRRVGVGQAFSPAL